MYRKYSSIKRFLSNLCEHKRLASTTLLDVFLVSFLAYSNENILVVCVMNNETNYQPDSRRNITAIEMNLRLHFNVVEIQFAMHFFYKTDFWTCTSKLCN